MASVQRPRTVCPCTFSQYAHERSRDAQLHSTRANEVSDDQKKPRDHREFEYSDPIHHILRNGSWRKFPLDGIFLGH